MSIDQLRRAADRLDQLAAEATPGPWRAVENYPDAWIVCSGQVDVAREAGGGDIEPGDAQWIATLGPQVAAKLAAWLRWEAARLDAIERKHPALPRVPENAPTKLARVLLGETDLGAS